MNISLSEANMASRHVPISGGRANDVIAFQQPRTGASKQGQSWQAHCSLAERRNRKESARQQSGDHVPW